MPRAQVVKIVTSCPVARSALTVEPTWHATCRKSFIVVVSPFFRNSAALRLLTVYTNVSVHAVKQYTKKNMGTRTSLRNQRESDKKRPGACAAGRFEVLEALDCLHARHVTAEFFTNNLNRVVADLSVNGNQCFVVDVVATIPPPIRQHRPATSP